MPLRPSSQAALFSPELSICFFCSIAFYSGGGTLSCNEDIVVADESALKKVAIRLPIGYNYSINEDQSVSIADGDEVPFTFDPPKVYDAEGNEEIARVELTHLENYILLTYVLSPKFMEKAVYPVTIDPVARTDYKDETAVTDCFVRSSQKDIVVTQDTVM